MSTNSLSFEEAFNRLESILEKMNSEKISLEESLKLYEEADKLILSCNKRLLEAEQRIELLSKQRNGELKIDESGRLMTEAFSNTSSL
ncbi:MAG: exodeoxyribonuclease VII small subunit [Rhabdochlamydiaceae bacterium]